MKILLLGDASNFHHTLAIGLRQLSHDVTVASDGSRWIGTQRDIDLSRSDSKLGGLKLWLKMRWLQLDRFTGYDIVSLADTNYATLRPHRLAAFFNLLRQHNKAIFITALANDTFFIDECLDPTSPLAYNEWRIGNTPTPYQHSHAHIAHAWQHDPLRSYCNHIAAGVNGAVAALYEYYLSIHRALPHDKIAYGGIPIDTKDIPHAPNVIDADGKVKIFLGYSPNRMAEKGHDRLLSIARAISHRYSNLCTLDVATNLPLEQFNRRLQAANIVIDQLYSYTPATTALTAMAMEKTVLSGAEAAYYNFINEPHLQPIINLDPTSDKIIYDTLEHTILNPQQLPTRGRQSRQFVEKHNDTLIVAKRYEKFWKQHL